MVPREAGGPDTEPRPPVCATGPSGQGKGNLRLLPHQPGAQSKGMNRVGASPGLPPGPRRRTAGGLPGLQQPGPRVRVCSEAAERPVGARHLGGCTANAHSRLHPHVPGGIGPTHSRPGVGLRPVSAAGSWCRCSRLTRGSRVAHASRGHHPRPRIPRPAPPRGVRSAFLPGSQEVPTPHPTVLLLSCPPTPPRPCTRGDAGEAPTAGRHTLSIAVILKPTPARRPPPPRPPDSAGPTGPLFHWELPISARDGSVLTIQRPQSEVLGFHSHAPDGRCCTPCPVWLTLHPRYLARCLGLAKY